jgi:hypothetical protein
VVKWVPRVKRATLERRVQLALRARLVSKVLQVSRDYRAILVPRVKTAQLVLRA